MATNEHNSSQESTDSKRGESQQRRPKRRRKASSQRRTDAEQPRKGRRRKPDSQGKGSPKRSGSTPRPNQSPDEARATKKRPKAQGQRAEGQEGSPKGQSVNRKRKRRRPEGKQVRPEGKQVRPEGKQVRPEGKQVRPDARKGTTKRRTQGGQRTRPAAQQRRSAPRHANGRPNNAAKRALGGLSPQQRSVAGIVAVALGIVIVALAGTFLFRTLRGNNEEFKGATSAEDIATTSVAKKNYTDINLLMVGDILFHYQVRQSGLQSDGTRNYDHVFEHFKSELEGKDIKVVNQETPLGGKEIGGDAPDGYGSYPTFNGPQEMGDAEAKAGFNVILKATNHTLDAGYAGLTSEMEFWKSKHPDVQTIGAVDPEDSSSTVEDIYVYEKDGFKVALLNYSFEVEEVSDPDGVVSLLKKDHIRSTMEKARESADMIVVFPHWGIEYETEPCDEQREWAQLFLDEGADVIIGNHPHVIQPVEMLESAEGKLVPCYWSTGNFISTSPDDMSLLGGVPELTLRKTNDGVCSVESAKLKMVVTHIGEGEQMTTYPLTEWTDELAATNKINTEMNPNTDNSTLTPEWAAEFCQKVLGTDYDAQTATFTLDLNAEPKKLTTSSSSDSFGSSSSLEDESDGSSTSSSVDSESSTDSDSLVYDSASDGSAEQKNSSTSN